MALRQLLIAREMQTLRAEQDKLTEALTGITERRTAWKAREANAEKALEEINDESTAEERAAFDTEAAEIEAEDAQITADENANATRSGEIDRRLEELQTELDELNARAANPRNSAAAGPENNHTTNTTERGNDIMEIRELVRDEGVRTFLGEFRTAIRTGAVNGAKLTIPTVMLPMISAETERSSKLLKHVNHIKIKGEGKQNVPGDAPEAVWTDMIGAINPVDLTIGQILTDGYKLGAYVSVPNPYIEDSDEDLAGFVIEQLGQSNGYALDKGILYGIGTNSPIGIHTRLAATSQPSWWQTNMPAFTDLHSSNIGTLSAANVTGAALYKELMLKLGVANSEIKGGRGDMFWAMNSTTWLTLQTELLSINAIGAVVTGAQKIMPIIGGTVEILDFVPNGEIIGGNGSKYLLVERRGIQIARSEHVKFLEDQTVFRATSRWDGIPVRGEGFAKFVLATSDTTAPTLAVDNANAADIGLSALSGTNLTLSPAFNRDVLEYTASVASTVSSTTITATAETGCTREALILTKGSSAPSTLPGNAANLSTGTNVIEIPVTRGTTRRVYKITVTKAGT